MKKEYLIKAAFIILTAIVFLPLLASEASAAWTACYEYTTYVSAYWDGTNYKYYDDCYAPKDYFCSGNTPYYYSSCPSHCTVGCGAPSCECTSGVCCDGCNYRSTSYACGGPYYDYGCPWGTSCGDDGGYRYRYRYCSGYSSSCTGSYGSWSSWYVNDSCSSSEYCSGGWCVYDPACACTSHYTYSCYNNDVYWYDSCGNREEKKEECNDGWGWYDLYRCDGNQPQRRWWERGCSGSSCYTNTNNWSNYGSACPGDYCDYPPGTPYCYNNDVYQDVTCHDAGCSAGSCYDNPYTDKQLVQDCGTGSYTSNYQCSGQWLQRQYHYKGCSGGSCYDYYDWVNYTDCGTNSWTSEYQCDGTQPQRKAHYKGCSGTSCYDYYGWQDWGDPCPGDYCDYPPGSPYCYNNDVYQDVTCHDAGCSAGSCYDNPWTDKQLLEDCGTGSYTSNYQCSGQWLQRQYHYKGCSAGSCYDYYGWVNYTDCGTSYWLDEYQCDDTQPQRKAHYKGCSASSCYDYYGWQDWGDPCPGDYCDYPPGSPYCDGNKVYQDVTCHDAGCSAGSCYDSPYTDTQFVEDCGQDKYCSGGSCVTCAAPYKNCDQNAANDCEVNTNTDPSNCGSCGYICGAGKICVSGVCTLSACPGPANFIYGPIDDIWYSGQFKISWGSVTGASTYRLEWCEEGYSFGDSGCCPNYPNCYRVTSNTETDVYNLTPCKRYSWRVRVESGTGCGTPGEWSNLVMPYAICPGCALGYWPGYECGFIESQSAASCVLGYNNSLIGGSAFKANCYDTDTLCMSDKCPSPSNSPSSEYTSELQKYGDGAVCNANVPSPTLDFMRPRTGVWDASEYKCIRCSGKFENKICGDEIKLYASVDYDICTKAGDGACEAACGAATECDEKNPGDSCAFGVCDTSCNCTGPDLIITNGWDDNGIVEYTIKNQGVEDAGESYTALYIKDTTDTWIYRANDYEGPLSAGGSRGYGSSQQSFPTYTLANRATDCAGRAEMPVSVCADYYGPRVDESNEDNNCFEFPVNCDTTPPTTTISPNGKDWVNYDVGFTLTCTDEIGGSGCQTTEYKIIDTSQTCNTSGLTAGTSGTVTCPADQACRKKVCFRSIDNANNVEDITSPSNVSNLFKIDKAAPTTEVGP